MRRQPATDRTPDFSPSAEAGSWDLVLADRVSGLVAATGKEGDGVPPGLARGVLGVVGDATVGYTVVVDPARADPAQTRLGLLAGLPPEAQDRLQVETSCTSAAALTDAWRVIVARTWHPTARTATFGMDLDPLNERIVVQIDPVSTSAEAAQALRGIAPHLVTVVAGACGRV